jgi:spermidine/putrescine transport system permease protein
LFFFVVPGAWIAFYSLGTKPPPGSGAVSMETLSVANYVAVTSELFLRIFWITIRTAGIGTVACLLVGFPVAYAIAYHVRPQWRIGLLFLLVLPYWTSFLLRTFAWRIILAPEGWLSQTLRYFGILDMPIGLLDTNAAVQLGIVYNYLPLMILPIFVALDRIDPALRHASMDLGAGPLRTLFSVTVPLAAPGIAGGDTDLGLAESAHGRRYGDHAHWHVGTCCRDSSGTSATDPAHSAGCPWSGDLNGRRR